VIGASGLPCPAEMKDNSKLDPYVKIELRGTETWKRQTKTKKGAGPNVVWNESLRFPRVKDDLVFVRYPPEPKLRQVF
jgi:Ca2+-dependent lipid-binding protein